MPEEKDRIPPHSLEAEMAVIGAMLVNSDALAKAIEYLPSEEYFYDTAHREIYKAIKNLFEKNRNVDIVTVTQELRRIKKLQKVGGASYISKLAENVIAPAHIEEYAKIVYGKWIRRKLIDVATRIIHESYDDSQEEEELLDRAENLIFEIKDTKLRAGFVPIKEILIDTMHRIETLRERRMDITGVGTGYIKLDEYTSGFQKGDFIIIAGRPSMGKTSLALNIAVNAAKEFKTPVGIFSLEMTKEAVVERMVCAEAKINMHRLRRGMLSSEEFTRLAETMNTLHQLEIYIDDSSPITALELKAKTRRLKTEKNVGIIFVDYLQLIEGQKIKGVQMNRQQEIAEISRSLKALAKELNIPVVALSQLSRRPEHREDRKPRLADLRESGAIEQDADVVIFIHRENIESTVAEIIIAKQRNGPTGKFKLTFLRDFTRFENFSPMGEEEEIIGEEVIEG